MSIPVLRPVSIYFGARQYNGFVYRDAYPSTERDIESSLGVCWTRVCYRFDVCSFFLRDRIFKRSFL